MSNINEDHENIIEVKKYIIAQITSTSNCDMEYKLCLDYMHNYKNDKYRELITHRTGKDPIELYKETTTFISSINSWLYQQLSNMSKKDRARLLVDESSLNKFIDIVHKKIKEDSHELFISRTQCT